MMPDAVAASENVLFSKLPKEIISSLHIEHVRVKFGEELMAPYAPITHAIFPTTAVVSAVGVMANGQTCEIGVVGDEGGVGLVGLMGAQTSPYGKIVQIEGDVIKVPLKPVKRAFEHGGPFQKVVLSFVERLATQIAQAILCNRTHNIEQRLLRWLLMRHDRIDGNVMAFTHEFMALMLGVNRATVTQAANKLQSLGYISYSWGKITILDREAMEANTCECYGIIQPLTRCISEVV